jgi:OmpA family protein
VDQGPAEDAVTTRPILVAPLVVLLGACATVPTGPSVMVLPGSSKSFEQFQTDDGLCRQWAQQQTGTTTGKAASNSATTGAVVGTAVGAAAGAALGAAAGNPAVGAAAGAGVGLLGGTAVGAGQAQGAYHSVQQRYNMAYMQCMYAKGNQIPVARGSVAPGYSSHATPPPPTRTPSPPPPPPPPPSNVPPPPAGTPPPPPPGVKG